MASEPWRGILVATALPFRKDLSLDLDAYGDHVRRLVAGGCDGVIPNGSLGEYQTLTPDERAAVVRTAVDAAEGAAAVVPGVSAYGCTEARRWAEQAGEAGARAVMLLPPDRYRADSRVIIEHFREVAQSGLPVVAYDNPGEAAADLTPELLAELHAEGFIVAVKERSTDVRRAYRIAELAPELDILVGADDVSLELTLAGATGWIGGFHNVFPHSCRELYESVSAGKLDTALPLYRTLHPLLRWGSRAESVQAIKLALDLTGGYGGPCRSPRAPLYPPQEAEVRGAVEVALAAGCR